MSDISRYNSKAIFISSGDFSSNQIVSGSTIQFSRIQDLGININYPISNEDYLDQDDESSMLSHPSVDVTLNWLLTNGGNERSAGFVTNGTTGALLDLDKERNIYIQIEDYNIDAIGSSTGISKKALGIGNVLLNSYNLNGAVGTFPSASATFLGLNITSYTGINNQQVPAVNYINGEPINNLFSLYPAQSQKDDSSPNDANNISALLPKDIVLEFVNDSPFGMQTNTLDIQSFDFNLNIERFDPLDMGDVYPESRPLSYPVEFDFTVEALLPTYIVDRLADKRCLNDPMDVNLVIKKPCSEFAAFELSLKDLRLEGQSVGQSIGTYESVTLQWKGRVTNPLSTQKNIFMTAYQGELIYELIGVVPITGYDNNGVQYYTEESIYQRRIAENQYTFQ